MNTVDIFGRVDAQGGEVQGEDRGAGGGVAVAAGEDGEVFVVTGAPGRGVGPKGGEPKIVVDVKRHRVEIIVGCGQSDIGSVKEQAPGAGGVGPQAGRGEPVPYPLVANLR